MTAPERVYERTREVLNDHPELGESLQTLIEIDAGREDWTFEDVPIDSGTFGELVSRDIVKRTDDGYRVADREAVRAAIAGEPFEAASDADTHTARDRTVLATLTDSISTSTVIGLLVGVLTIVLWRCLQYRSVLRDGAVVSPSNDPYFFRYIQEQLIARDGLHPSALQDVNAAAVRPLSHALNWWLTELLGGTPAAASLVAGWLPVLASATLGVVIFATTMILTRDVRAATLSAVLLGVTPVHAVYTSLGFFDHQLHQYFWLGVLLLTLVWLGRDLKRRIETSTDPKQAVRRRLRDGRVWLASGILAVTIGVTPHLWGGGPLILLPVALYIALRTVTDVQADLPPERTLAPVLAATIVGAVLAYLSHAAWGWRRAFAVFTPALLALGGVSVVGLAVLWRRQDLPARWLLASEGMAAIAVVGLFRVLQPSLFADAISRAGDLIFRATAIESGSLYAFNKAIIFGPLYQVGLYFYIAVVVLAVIGWTATREYRPGWLAVVAFGGFFAALAGLQTRFAGQMTIPFSILGAVGILWLLGTVDLVRPIGLRTNSAEQSPEESSGIREFKSPSARKGAYIGGFLLLLIGLNLVTVPGLYSQTHYGEAYDAAAEIDDHAAVINQSYPENYVLSQWGENRMYNYFVNGEARGYGYARANYDSFLNATPNQAYDQYSDRVGYISIAAESMASQSTYTDVINRTGFDTPNAGHYQAVYASDAVTAFALVPGATLQVSASEGTTVTAETQINVSGDMNRRTYTQTASMTDGTATLRVPYPGEYTVEGQTVTVPRQAVYAGEQIQVGG